VQAQEGPAAALAVGARALGLTAAAVERARVETREVVRTWAMRGTLHLLATEDVGWLLGLFGPALIHGGRGRREQLGLDEAATARGLRALREILEGGGPVRRSALRAELKRRRIPSEGQATIHLAGRAALEGLVCFGPDEGGETTFVWLKDWADVGPARPREAALSELARRYLRGYAPATAEDLAAWAGLPLGEARQALGAIAGETAEVETPTGRAWMPGEQLEWLEAKRERRPVVRLLPRFDNLLLGYADRTAVVPEAHQKRLRPGGGMVHAALLVDGRAVGTWRLKKGRGGATVEVEPFEALSAGEERAAGEEAEAVRRFVEGGG
jgi:hypothetical protein